jgi:hypothetical protein
MKEVNFRDGTTITELVDTFKKQSSSVIHGEYKLVGIQVYLVNEEDDILASPGMYSKDFNKEDFEDD